MAKKRMATLPTTPAEPIDMQAAIDRVTPPDPHRGRLTDFVQRVAAIETPHRPHTRAESELLYLKRRANELLSPTEPTQEADHD